MTETKRIVPASGTYPGMTQLTKDGRTVQMQGTGPSVENAIRAYLKETAK